MWCGLYFNGGSESMSCLKGEFTCWFIKLVACVKRGESLDNEDGNKKVE